MRVALVNPSWSFEGSIYFGCREPHLPLEYGYARALLIAAGHDVAIFDGQLDCLSTGELADRVAAWQPGMVVLTTAPSYLFWRCAPPELRVPMETLAALRERGVHALEVAIGPHASTTPRSTVEKLGVAAAVMGEAEEVIAQLASTDFSEWKAVPSVARRDLESESVVLQGSLASTDMARMPALHWDDRSVARHAHHHHRFDVQPEGLGAEMETSRGCPYHCTFCAKDNFRDKYRKRPLATVLEELDGLLAQGVRYVYFIDEIFLPDRALLEALATREVKFGVQMRIDNWSEELLDLLGKAGCVSIEAGVESITPEGRSLLAKKCKATTEELTALLLRAKKSVPFVQANLIEGKTDDTAAVAAWRDHLKAHGVWSNEPVPLFPYPGSPEYTIRWGAPDDRAWERAHEHYLSLFARFSDIQETRPVALAELERVDSPGAHHV